MISEEGGMWVSHCERGEDPAPQKLQLQLFQRHLFFNRFFYDFFLLLSPVAFSQQQISAEWTDAWKRSAADPPVGKSALTSSCWWCSLSPPPCIKFTDSCLRSAQVDKKLSQQQKHNLIEISNQVAAQKTIFITIHLCWNSILSKFEL